MAERSVDVEPVKVALAGVNETREGQLSTPVNVVVTQGAARAAEVLRPALKLRTLVWIYGCGDCARVVLHHLPVPFQPS